MFFVFEDPIARYTELTCFSKYPKRWFAMAKPSSDMKLLYMLLKEMLYIESHSIMYRRGLFI
jgi:hypothetical protein